MNLNKALIIGRVTRDPELRALPSGSNVANFSLATNRVWKDKDQKQQEATEFHNCVAFGKQAETLAQYVKKGQLLYVEGRLQTQSWEKDGVKHYKTEIVVEQFQFGPKAANAAPADTPEYPEEELNPEDIPY